MSWAARDVRRPVRIVAWRPRRAEDRVSGRVRLVRCVRAWPAGGVWWQGWLFGPSTLCRPDTGIVIFYASLQRLAIFGLADCRTRSMVVTASCWRRVTLDINAVTLNGVVIQVGWCLCARV